MDTKSASWSPSRSPSRFNASSISFLREIFSNSWVHHCNSQGSTLPRQATREQQHIPPDASSWFSAHAFANSAWRYVCGSRQLNFAKNARRGLNLTLKRLCLLGKFCYFNWLRGGCDHTVSRWNSQCPGLVLRRAPPLPLSRNFKFLARLISVDARVS